MVMNPEMNPNGYYENIRVGGSNLKLELVERDFKFEPRPINPIHQKITGFCFVGKVTLNSLSLVDANCACTLCDGQEIPKSEEKRGSCACYSRQQGQRCPIIIVMDLTVITSEGKKYDIDWSSKNFQMEYLLRSNQGAHEKAYSLMKGDVGDCVKMELTYRCEQIFELHQWELTGWMKSGTITDDITRPDENATSYQRKNAVVDKVQSSNQNLHISSMTAYQPTEDKMLRNIILKSSIQEIKNRQEEYLKAP